MNLKGPIRAVLFDVDGTLYHQMPLRFLMALELSLQLIVQRSYRAAACQWRLLSHFRHVREELRHLGAATMPLAELQYVETAKRIGATPDEVKEIVTKWMYQRPLKYLGLCRYRGLKAFLAFLNDNGIPIGVFSDYPVADKLRTLGLSQSVTITLCATDPEINAFKPHPKGFQVACSLLAMSPEEVLYVGDRLETDAVGSAAAGMPCALLVGRRIRSRTRLYRNTVAFSSFEELGHAFVNYFTH